MREGWNAWVIRPTHLSFLSVHFHFLIFICSRFHAFFSSFSTRELVKLQLGSQPKNGLPVLNQEFRDPAKSFFRLVKKLIKNVHLLPFFPLNLLRLYVHLEIARDPGSNSYVMIICLTPVEPPRIQVTTPLQYKNLDGHIVHTVAVLAKNFTSILVFNFLNELTSKFSYG